MSCQIKATNKKCGRDKQSGADKARKIGTGKKGNSNQVAKPNKAGYDLSFLFPPFRWPNWSRYIGVFCGVTWLSAQSSCQDKFLVLGFGLCTLSPLICVPNFCLTFVRISLTIQVSTSLFSLRYSVRWMRLLIWWSVSSVWGFNVGDSCSRICGSRLSLPVKRSFSAGYGILLCLPDYLLDSPLFIPLYARAESDVSCPRGRDIFGLTAS